MKQRHFKTLSLVVILSGILACSVESQSRSKSIDAKIQGMGDSNKISVMAYNVENLFDTEHDAGKDDYTNLPRAYKKAHAKEMQAACQSMSTDYFRKECMELDWSEEVLDTKLSRLADSILQVNGRGPDILIMEEVENINVVRILNRGYLKAAGYQTEILIEAEDRRGIDVAVLSRLPLASPAEIHLIDFTPNPKDPNWKKPLTRGILEAPLKLPNGETLYVFGFHFPSQANPVQERMDAVDTLNRLMSEKPAGALMVAGGDSNITAVEDQNTGLKRQVLSAQWDVSNIVGCQKCSGTHFYRNEWDFLDLLLFSPSLKPQGQGAYAYDPSSIQVMKQGQYQLQKNGTPARFNANSSIGISDHLPIYAEILLKSKQ
ncbi:MAG: hypothetical protein COT73_07440 [Bdellovibrio sp. CG10_big_fil_rev_8_21_14_0_10_47_8]|nr:MAG: hypothetical protein COT73_07440 [Bdellovibrio sp. CG10_big_fil_rev_8_21_14_0_10_47_8]